MKTINQSNEGGRFVLIYGETGVGKSTSALLTMPQPIDAIFTEPRDPRKFLLDQEIDVDFKFPESYEDLIAYLDGEVKKETLNYKSTLFDSASYFMNVSLQQSIQDETYDAEIFKRRRNLVDMTRVDEAGFGALSSLMKRVCKLLGMLSQRGILVVATALVMENPKFNRDLSAFPAFLGRDFPTNFPAYFDVIGLVEKRTDENGEIIYPPLIKFEGEGFLCKWTGIKPVKKLVGPLDFKKIFK